MPCMNPNMVKKKPKYDPNSPIINKKFSMSRSIEA